MIFKRKSFHVFFESERLCEEELQTIRTFCMQAKPLDASIRIGFRILNHVETSCRRGEYCILFYSEKKQFYLQNIGFLVEQVDLQLAKNSIGCCWYGVGTPDRYTMEGNLEYVIMLAIAKQPEHRFRKDVSKATRLALKEIYLGIRFESIVQVSRYAPSACNSQPWKIEDQEHGFAVYRVFRKQGIMPKNMVAYYNQIDLGIFLLFIELCLDHERYQYQRILYEDEYREGCGALTARYLIS